MDVILLRHGETKSNQQRRYLGWSDEPLSLEGAAALHRLPFPVDTAFVSPLLRAKESAKLFFPQAELVEVEDFKEIDFGDFEGKTADEMRDSKAYRDWVENGCLTAVPGGESVEAFKERTTHAFAGVVAEKLNSANNGQPLVIVAHGGTLMAVAEAYAIPHRDYFGWSCKPGCGYRFRLDSTEWLSCKRLSFVEEICGLSGTIATSVCNDEMTSGVEASSQ